jgi:hypothetical protein
VATPGGKGEAALSCAGLYGFFALAFFYESDYRLPTVHSFLADRSERTAFLACMALTFLPLFPSSPINTFSSFLRFLFSFPAFPPMAEQMKEGRE